MSFPGDFFEAVVPFLNGEISASEVGKRLGPSASGEARLNYYRVLMERNARLIIGSLYPSVRALLERDDAEAFSRLVLSYAAKHPGPHYEPNHWGEEFPEYLSSLEDVEKKWPGITEVADYEWLLYAVGIVQWVREPLSLEPCADVQQPEPPHINAIIRHYDYDVLSLSKQIRRNPREAKLEKQPTALIFYQRAQDGRSAVFRPTLPELLAVAQASGELTSAHAQLTTASDLAAATLKLQKLEILVAN